MNHAAAVFGAIAGLCAAAVLGTLILICAGVRAAWIRWRRPVLGTPAVRALRALAPVQSWKDRT